MVAEEGPGRGERPPPQPAITILKGPPLVPSESQGLSAVTWPTAPAPHPASANQRRRVWAPLARQPISCVGGGSEDQSQRRSEAWLSNDRCAQRLRCPMAWVQWDGGVGLERVFREAQLLTFNQNYKSTKGIITQNSGRSFNFLWLIIDTRVNE